MRSAKILPDDAAEAVSLEADLLDQIQESVIVFSPEGHISKWNKASERIYGWSYDQVKGRLLHEFLGGQEWPNRATLESLELEGPSSTEVRRKTRTGREVIITTTLSLRPAVAGHPLMLIETGFDVTLRRHADLSAHDEKRHYRNVFQAIPASVWDIDFSEARAIALGWLENETVDPRQWFAEHPERVRELMRATYARDVNEEAMKLFGPCDREKLLVNVERYWPETSTGVFADWIVSSLKGESYFSRETRQYRYDGEEFDALFTASYAPGTVEEGRLVVTIVDNSEVKGAHAAVRKSEAFYTDMFNGSAFSAWHLDATRAWAIYHELYALGVTDLRDQIAKDPELLLRVMNGIRIVDVNAMTLQLFEAKDRSEIIGSTIVPFWFPDGRRETLIGSLADAFAGIPTYRGMGRMRTLKGNEIDVLFTRSASTALSSIGQVLLVIVDMTEKVRAQTALIDLQSNLAHAARVSSLGEITASIAHEVNQPLAAIICNAAASLTWLGHSPPNITEVRALLDAMISDGRRASDIVARIRSMASPQPGKYRELSFNGLVEGAMILLNSQLRQFETLASYKLDPNLPQILGDPIQLQQVIINLVLNAVQAMEGRSNSRLLIQTKLEDETVNLIVEDNGPGIQAEDISRLFNSFFTTKPDGMGIGLAICQNIVEAHGGTILAENCSSGGARFIVRL